MLSTYISRVSVDLWQQTVTLTWIGPDAEKQISGPFRCSPGKGLPGVDCDPEVNSRRVNSNCTPKGEWRVLGYQRRFVGFPDAEWVTQFQSLERGIALHYYPFVPPYPDSHGCVRIADYNAAKLIYENTEPLRTRVAVYGELRPSQKVLKRGERGPTVAKIQRKLAERGYQLTVDGEFGPSTESVVKQLQKDAGLPVVDGVFGPMSYTALFESSALMAQRALAHA